MREYSQRYGAVEADTTYYRVPSETLGRGWREKTPEGFRMAAKFPRGVVHAGKGPRPDGERALLVEVVGEEVERFLGVMRLLGEKAGPLLVQLPSFNKSHFAGADGFLTRLDAFLGALPAHFRSAVGVRNEQWYSGALCEVLRGHGAAFCLSELLYLPHPAEVMERLDVATADFSYVRLIGDRKRIDALTKVFDKEVVDQGDRIRRLAEAVKEVGARVEVGWGA